MNRFLKILSGIGVVLLAFVIGVLLNGHYFGKESDIGSPNTNWMGDIRDDVPLCEVVIPGSHDAGTYCTNYLARTQGYSVKTQLEMGARYFDLRVNKTENGYYMFHAMFNGEKFSDVLDAICDFIKANPTETLILDFQHFKGGAEADVAAFLEERLADFAVKNTAGLSDLQFISALTMGDARGKCVILFGGNEDIAAEHDFIFNRNNDSCTKPGMALNSCYVGEYNKMNSDGFIGTALPYYYNNIEEKIAAEGCKGLFVLQGQLTDGMLIFGPYSKEKTHDKAMSAYIEGISEDAHRLELTNIIMRDFLTTAKCSEIIRLNRAKENFK